MLFSSYEFICVFLPLAIAGMRLLGRSASDDVVRVWLILLSAVFYFDAGLESLVVIFPSLLLDFLIVRALLRSRMSDERLRGLIVAIGISANIAVLGYFKYRNFFLASANSIFATHFELGNLVLPLGLSFIIFQKIAFLCDVRAGRITEVRFLDFVLFVLFFPRVLAGPIVRYNELMPQFALLKKRNAAEDLAVGVCLFAIGLFKKTVLADQLGQFVGPAFGPPGPLSDPHVSLLTAWTGVLAYTFQLYFDFSGYSDMALGVARMLGILLPMNFNSPLKAANIVDFWNRWHITLTRFLTEFVYTPTLIHLTRRRIASGKSVLRVGRSTFSAIIVLIAMPMLITMAISGLWHGAGWQFVIWGLLHGVYLTINQTWRIVRPKFWPDDASHARIMTPIGHVLTFAAVVMALVFFRADSVESATTILSAMLGANGVFPPDVDILQRVGVQLPWDVLIVLVPTVSAAWSFVSFLIVTLLPNSLELLRAFQPALDYPTAQTSERRQIHALEFNRLTAAIVALLFVLGVAGINRAGTFIYGQF